MLAKLASWGPTPFRDSRDEALFLSEFRSSALTTAAYAASLASISYALFLIVAVFTEHFSWGAVWTRLVLIISLASVGVVLRVAPRFSTDNYSFVVGTASVVALGGAIVLLAMGASGSPTPQEGASPALVFGLFLHYTFLRLPLVWAVAIGIGISVASILWGVPLVVGGNEEARTALYLIMTNAVGFLTCSSIELRERELFTQRRRAEAAQTEVERRARAAEEAHQEKTRLLAAVSHDLRQPMVAAVFQLSALKSGLDKGDLPRAIRQAERLEESVDTLGATLDHLLTAARYDSGTEPIRIGAVELNPLLRRLEQTFAADAAAKGIELRVRIPERRLVVTSDEMTLWRVLLNLVSNAVKFTHSEGRRGRGVLVKVRAADGVCRIDVADTGEGIPARFIEEVWQPYFQVANVERNRERGLGLGLFLVRRALDHLPGHKLVLRSRPRRGSRFSLSLPGGWFSHAEIIDDPKFAQGSEDLDVLAGAYLMLIEDDRDARRAIEELFSEWGAVYSSGATVEEALRDDESATRLVDAIVSDYRLPGGRDGIESVAELRRRLGSEVPAVIITGESDLASIRRRVPQNVTVLQKPFSVAAFARPIVEAVRAARSQERI